MRVAGTLGYVGAVNDQDLKAPQGRGLQRRQTSSARTASSGSSRRQIRRHAPHPQGSRSTAPVGWCASSTTPPAKTGSSLRLTMDVGIQKAAEGSLRQGILRDRQMRDKRSRTGAKNSPRRADRPVLDARDSSVIAMASSPTFDVTKFTPAASPPTSSRPSPTRPATSRCSASCPQGLYPQGRPSRLITAMCARAPRGDSRHTFDDKGLPELREPAPAAFWRRARPAGIVDLRARHRGLEGDLYFYNLGLKFWITLKGNS